MTNDERNPKPECRNALRSVNRRIHNGAHSLQRGCPLVNPGQILIPGRKDVVPDFNAERRRAKGSLVTPTMCLRVTIRKGQHTAAVMVSGREVKKLVVASAWHQDDEGRRAQILRGDIHKGKGVRRCGDIGGFPKYL